MDIAMDITKDLNDAFYTKIIDHLKINIKNEDFDNSKLSQFISNFCFAFDSTSKAKHEWNIVSKKKINKKIKICEFCNKPGHTSRTCIYENMYKKIYRLAIGKWAEIYVSYFPCPRCKSQSLVELNDNSPSLDIVCFNCDQKIEVKSKCLSVDNLPTNLYLPHGNYNKFIDRKSEGLDMIILIYGVDRRSKTYFVRRVLYIDNDNLHDTSIIRIERNSGVESSQIIIPDINNIVELSVDLRESIIVLDKMSKMGRMS
jgi:transcription elongation factor Elf1